MRRSPTTWLLTPIVLALALAALPAAAQQAGRYANQSDLRFRIGELSPRGDSEYWRDKRFDFTNSSPEAFEDVLFGIDYFRFLGPRLGVMIGGGVYNAEVPQSVRGITDPQGFRIRHRATLETTSIEAGLVFHLSRRDASIVPYVGGGGGLYAWRLEEDGDFVDFATDPLEIFSARFEDDGSAFGWFYLAGVEVPVGDSWRVFAESRWQRADDELGGDFEGLGQLDLSGRTISFGVGVGF